MTISEWEEANYLLRHLYTRVAAHRLNHRMCATKGFHSPNEGWQCTLCGGPCNTYHIIECTRRTSTLSHRANDTNFQWFMSYNLYSVFILNPLLHIVNSDDLRFYICYWTLRLQGTRWGYTPGHFVSILVLSYDKHITLGYSLTLVTTLVQYT